MIIGNEGDKVVLVLGGRKRDVLLSCSEAFRMVEQLRVRADIASRQTLVLFKGDAWQCKIESYDGCVVLRFHGPEVGFPERVPLPHNVARQLADTVEFKAQQAQYKMRFVFAS